MPRPYIPSILISCGTERRGAEFQDASLSLSHRYTEALLASGALPLVLPPAAPREVIADAVRRADGVLLTGGCDVQPHLYQPNLPDALAKTVGDVESDRDAAEQALIDEALAQRKPMLGICRGIQILNVALGGTLIVDIPSQVAAALNHRRTDQKTKAVHDVELAPGSMLADIAEASTLSVNSTHHQAVARVADRLTAVATSPDGVVEAVELKEKGAPFLLAVQWHPERLLPGDQASAKLFARFVEASVRRGRL
jgi:putative glutamine amidotransferase